MPGIVVVPCVVRLPVPLNVPPNVAAPVTVNASDVFSVPLVRFRLDSVCAAPLLNANVPPATVTPDVINPPLAMVAVPLVTLRVPAPDRAPLKLRLVAPDSSVAPLLIA